MWKVRVQAKANQIIVTLFWIFDVKMSPCFLHLLHECRHENWTRSHCPCWCNICKPVLSIKCYCDWVVFECSTPSNKLFLIIIFKKKWKLKWQVVTKIMNNYFTALSVKMMNNEEVRGGFCFVLLPLDPQLFLFFFFSTKQQNSPRLILPQVLPL